VEASAELAAVTRRYLGAFARGDTATLLNLFSRTEHISLIGSDPAEWMVGRTLLPLLEAQFHELAGLRIDVDEVHAWSHGDIGWSMTSSTVHFGAHSSLMRWSLVFALEDGTWRIIHNHNSAGLTNEEVLGTTLTLPGVELVADAVVDERPDLSASAALDGTLTVLFSDIEDSTRLAESRGDREWVAFLDAYDRQVRALVARWNGTVVKSMGDGYMAVFPSARAAVACGLQVRDAHPDVRTRVGLHVGDVVRTNNDFFGHTVTMAARIAAEAPGGDVLVSDVVRQLVTGTTEFEFHARREVQLKGIAGTHVVHRADVATDAER
jgi:class 3 adenylate cyclase